MVFVHRRHLYGSGDKDVGFVARVADFVDALPRHESLQLHLAGKDGSFIVIQQREQWDLPLCLWRTRHGSPLAPELNFRRPMRESLTRRAVSAVGAQVDASLRNHLCTAIAWHAKRQLECLVL